jgi:hypothetical protein
VKLVEAAPVEGGLAGETKDVLRPEASRSSRAGRGRPRQAIAPETFEPPTPTSQTFEAMDRALHAAVGRLSHGVSPIVLARAYVDWLVHLGLSPGKQAQLVDKTRLPYRMHSEYLRQLFLNNDLAQGRYEVDGRPITISDVRVPIFAVGTTRDHVAPWVSVYKIHLLTDTEVTFVLTSGGHNAGIVSEPGHPGRGYQLATKREGDMYVDPETWQAATPACEGSWWPEWVSWLQQHSSEKIQPPLLGAPEAGYPALEDAPGRYVVQP